MKSVRRFATTYGNQIKEVIRHRSIETFSITCAEGNLLPLNRWMATRPSKTSVLARANGTAEVLTTHSGSSYLICAGTSHDFKRLSRTSGVRIGGLREVFISSAGFSDAHCRIMLLEFDANRMRVGEKSLSLGQAQTMYLGHRTEYVLVAIYIVGSGKISLDHLVVDLTDGTSRWTEQNAGIVPLRLEVQRAQSTLDRLQKELHRPLGASPDPTGRQRGADPRVNEVLRSCIMDLDFYTAVRGTVFEDEHQACEDFLERGMFEGLSCTPLIELPFLPQEVQRAWRNGDIDRVLTFLRSDRKNVGETGEFFDARIVPLPERVSIEHPGGVLGWYMENAKEDDFMPTEQHSVRWSAFRRAVSAAKESELRSVNARHPRLSDEWNSGDEAHLRQAVAQSPLGDGPLISVIMPAWNRAEVIGRAIQSVLSQDYQNFELIIVDDGSTDGTLDVVNAFAEVDPRVRVEACDHAGVSRARNIGIEVATGELVAFLDSDNRWQPDYLRLMCHAMRGEQASRPAFAYAGTQLETDNGTFYRSFEGGKDDLMIRNHVDLNVLVAQRESVIEVGGFDENLPRWVDHDLVLRLADLGEARYVPFIGCIYDDSGLELDRITNRESDNWQWVVLAKAWEDWKDPQAANVVAGRTSIVMPVYGERHMTRRAVRTALGATSGHDVEVILMDNGSDFQTSWHLRCAFASDPRVKYKRLPQNMNFGIASNIGALSSTGEFLMFLNNDTESDQDWLGPMLEVMANQEICGVQPLLLYPDNSIQTAGTTFVAPNSLPIHFLAGQPPETAAGSSSFYAVTAAAMLVRRHDFVRVEGFDALFVNGMEDLDYCLRSAGGKKKFVVETSARIYHHESRTPGRGTHILENRRLFMQRWRGGLPEPEFDRFEKHGLEIASINGDGLEIPAPRVQLRKCESESERWGIKYSSVGGPLGDRWGDTAFVDSLASALRSQGKTVVTYRHGANLGAASVNDDVNLVIRGLDKVAPIPGQLNVLWVISHPEDVTTTELEGFDLVFAASESWARRMSERTKRKIRYMPQATDSSRFNPSVLADSRSRGPLFVGSVHPGRRRGIVEDALAMNLPLTVIGGGWNGVLPKGVLEAERVANTELAKVYRSSTRVLADHWQEMAEEGFIQNRVFDAVACGCKVVSDHVDGLEIFEGAVQSYKSREELRFLLSPESDGVFPDEATLDAISKKVIREHSFDARACQLITAVEEALRAR